MNEKLESIVALAELNKEFIENAKLTQNFKVNHKFKCNNAALDKAKKRYSELTVLFEET